MHARPTASRLGRATPAPLQDPTALLAAVAMLALSGYLAVAVTLLIVKAIQLGTG